MTGRATVVVSSEGAVAAANPVPPDVLTVTATRAATDSAPAAAVSFAVSNPPSTEDEARLAALAAMPGLAGATWTTTPGRYVRP